LEVPDDELARRRKALKPKTRDLSGYLKRYAAQVGAADIGAVLE
jgi:dihydroxyacid dehydratase/phosphogluconate dehydratase